VLPRVNQIAGVQDNTTALPFIGDPLMVAESVCEKGKGRKVFGRPRSELSMTPVLNAVLYPRRNFRSGDLCSMPLFQNDELFHV
jgi:hypothetical protein